MVDTFEKPNKEIAIEIHHIENSIDFLLTMYLRHRLNPVGTKVVWKREIVKISEIPMGKQARLLELVEDPLRYSLRKSIIELVEFLYEELKLKHPNKVGLEFENSFYRIIEMDKPNENSRGYILDKMFDGIGGWYS